MSQLNKLKITILKKDLLTNKTFTLKMSMTFKIVLISVTFPDLENKIVQIHGCENPVSRIFFSVHVITEFKQRFGSCRYSLVSTWYLIRIVETRLAELLVVIPVALIASIVVLHVDVCGKSVWALGYTQLG